MGTSLPPLLTMKTFLCITALAATASAAPQLLGHGLGGHGLVGHGGHIGHGVAVAAPVVHAVAHPVAHAVHPVAHAVGFNDLAEISPYTYQYGVNDDYSGAAFQQTESDDGTGVRDGSYSVNLPDGRIQHVNYHANDATGYIAEVTYDGTAAYPDIVGVGHGVVGHAVAHPVAHAVARPVAVAHPVAVGHAGHGLVGHGLAGHGLVGGVVGK